MSLRDYLSTRRAEIDRQMKALKAELVEIKLAEAAINGGTNPPDADGATLVVQAGPGSGKSIRSGSIKDWVLRVLKEQPDGLDTDNIIAAVELIGGPAVPRNSMTPQLSRLKAARLIDLDGRFWRRVAPQGESAHSAPSQPEFPARAPPPPPPSAPPPPPPPPSAAPPPPPPPVVTEAERVARMERLAALFDSTEEEAV